MQKRLEIQEDVGVSEVRGLLEIWNLCTAGFWISLTVLCLHVSMSIPTVSGLLPPTSYIFCSGSLGQVPLHVLWPMVTCEDGGMTSGWWFVCCFLLFPFQWWVRPESVFFGSEK